MSANSDLLDAALRHEVGLRRLSNATVRKIIAALNTSEAELERKIRTRLGWIADRGFESSDYTLRRLEANLVEVRKVLREAYTVMGRDLRRELLAAGEYEAAFQGRLLAGTARKAGVVVDLGPGLSREVLRAVVERRPFQGGLLRDWAKKLEADAFTRLRGGIRQGLLQGEGIDQIVRRVRGTRAAGYADGILQLSRRDAESVVRTAVSHTLNGARDELFAGQGDLLKGVQWVSVLDSRVTTGCAIRDGLLYDLDHRPIDHDVPWEEGPGRRHFGCRATSVGVLRSWRELGIAAKAAPAEMRASMNGEVPGRTTFANWIKRQPAAVQDEVLGRTRGMALRRGEAGFADLFDDKGRFLSLAELARLEAAA